MAMVKADGYGHGMVKAAKAFQRAGCRVFGVAELREGISLRQAGISGDIYVTIGFAEEDAGLIFQYNLTPVLYGYDQAKALSDSAVTLAREIAIHVKVDTGMSRLGIFPEELISYIHAVSKLPGIRIAGIMSHFPDSDDPQKKSTERNFAAFAAAWREIEGRGGVLRHIANSGAVLNFPDTYCDMVRAGIALYGYHPGGRAGMVNLYDGELIPAMSFSSRVLQVKTVPAGTGISYGHSYITKNETRLAVLPVGYEDGYSRSLSNIGAVLIHGQRAAIRGRVCMNMCMVDVTAIEDVRAGDEAVLLGGQGGQVITADDIAAGMGSISYEVLCMLGNNNKRHYKE